MNLLLSFLLVLAFAAEAVAQCGYSEVYVNYATDICGKKNSDDTLECNGWNTLGGTMPTDAFADVSIVEAVGFLVKSSDGSIVPWGTTYDRRAGIDSQYNCPGTGTCVGGARDTLSCNDDDQCPGGSCESFSGTCAGGPDNGNACADNADCGDYIFDSLPGGTGFSQITHDFVFETGCALAGTTVTCWGNTGPWTTSQCRSEADPSDWGTTCTTNADCNANYCESGVAFPGGAFTNLAKMSGNLGTYCGVKTDGSIACWGHDDHEEDTIISGVPAGTDYVKVSLEYYAACALKTDNSVVCWGRDDGGWGDMTPPVGVAFTDIAVAWGVACGVTTDKAIVCWGDEAGNLYPAVETNCDWVKIVATADADFCALDDDGDLDCWGYAGYYSYEPMPDPECSAATTACPATTTTTTTTTTTLPSTNDNCMIFTVQ